MKRFVCLVGLLPFFAGISAAAQVPWVFERPGFGGGLDVNIIKSGQFVEIRTTHEAFLCVYGFSLDQKIIDYNDQVPVAVLRYAGSKTLLNPKNAVWLQVIAVKTSPVFECDSQHLSFFRTPNELSDWMQVLARSIQEYGVSLWAARFIYLGSAQGEGAKIQGAVENQNPTPLVTWKPQIPFVGQEVIFDASNSYDSDGGIIWVGWDFGDDGIFDTTGTSLSVSFRFQSAGYQKVRLTLKDNRGGQASTVLTLRVNPLRAEEVFSYTINAECVIIDSGGAKEYVLVESKYYSFNAGSSSFRSIGWDFNLDGRNDSQAVAIMSFPKGVRYIAINGINSTGEYRGEQIKLKVVTVSELSVYCRVDKIYQPPSKPSKTPVPINFKTIVAVFMVLQVVGIVIWGIINKS